jgi:hypothetical protein
MDQLNTLDTSNPIKHLDVILLHMDGCFTKRSLLSVRDIKLIGNYLLAVKFDETNSEIMPKMLTALKKFTFLRVYPVDHENHELWNSM